MKVEGKNTKNLLSCLNSELPLNGSKKTYLYAQAMLQESFR